MISIFFYFHTFYRLDDDVRSVWIHASASSTHSWINEVFNQEGGNHGNCCILNSNGGGGGKQTAVQTEDSGPCVCCVTALHYGMLWVCWAAGNTVTAHRQQSVMFICCLHVSSQLSVFTFDSKKHTRTKSQSEGLVLIGGLPLLEPFLSFRVSFVISALIWQTTAETENTADRQWG